MSESGETYDKEVSWEQIQTGLLEKVQVLKRYFDDPRVAHPDFVTVSEARKAVAALESEIQQLGH